MAINTNILKAYAPEARRAFIAAVKARAARFGITETGSSPIREEGNVAIINEQPYPRSFAQQRRELDQKITLRGYASVMEEVAYTWFNRFAAIRYMELHDYLEHGVRVLSHPNGGSTPEIIEKAAQVDLPGLKRDHVVALKIDGTKDDELYRILIVAQCNALHAAMPFLFERIEDETELLLPDNLLHSESLVRQLVEGIPEADWQHIEIIGWLYQFYISEKKDQVIGEVVASEDIPAATQLFTPNWIVKYMVQNSLGAKWLASNPGSALRTKMEYYVQPSDQPAEMQAQVASETPEQLNPETLTFLDPASGSGHILIEAYNLFREIYLERGYRTRDFPRLILEKNVFGLDIDDRAAQLSGFALLMRARRDDRAILASSNPAKLNVIAVQETQGLDAARIADAILPAAGRFDLVPATDLLPESIAQPTLATNEPSTIERGSIEALLKLFAHAKTFGSLIRVPPSVATTLPILSRLVEQKAENDISRQLDYGHAIDVMTPLVKQAILLNLKYDVVAANPPYMGDRYYTPILKAFCKSEYPTSGASLFSAFIDRSIHFTKRGSFFTLITLHNWMFLADFTELRSFVLDQTWMRSGIHLGPRAFPEISGEVVQTMVAAWQNIPSCGGVTTLSRLVKGDSELKRGEFLKGDDRHLVNLSALANAIEGRPLVYWLPAQTVRTFEEYQNFRVLGQPKAGLSTADNPKFMRYWFEVDITRIGFGCRASEETKNHTARWYPCNSSYDGRKWFGNHLFVVNWENNGNDIKALKDKNGKRRSAPRNEDQYFRMGVTWNKLGSSTFTARFVPSGFIFDDTSRSSLHDEEPDALHLLSLLNSRAGSKLLTALNPTMSFTNWDLERLPVTPVRRDAEAIKDLVAAHKDDWDSIELSWDFAGHPLLTTKPTTSMQDAFDLARLHREQIVAEARSAEEQNDIFFDQQYGFDIDPIESASRTGGSIAPFDIGVEVRRFASYAVGCMFGRYSIDRPGLIIGNQSDSLSDYFQKVPNRRFEPDTDNVIPIMEDYWFEDDVTARFSEFLRVSFGEDRLAENIAFVEGVFGKDLRRFFQRDFFADHVRRYQKRPIYWLFSSGKERAFEAMVYLHRYNEGTLARMRLEYVVPLQTQMAGRVQRLTDELRMGNLSSSETKKRNVQLEKLQKQQDELRRFEEELHHFADQRIKLDLDDGVKVNYGKFGNLLADVKTITGGKDD